MFYWRQSFQRCAQRHHIKTPTIKKVHLKEDPIHTL